MNLKPFLVGLVILTLSSFSSAEVSGKTSPLTYFLDTSVSNLTATFPAAPQLVFTGQSGKICAIDTLNTTGSSIELNCSQTTQPNSNSGSINSNSILIPASVGYSNPDSALVPYPFVNECWARSISGTISSGVLVIVGWGC